MTLPKILSLTLLAFILGNTNIKSQNLYGYTDYMDRFYVFDNGKSSQIEHLSPQSFKVGANELLYQANNGHLMMYRNGQTSTLERLRVNAYHTSDYLSAFSIYSNLVVIYQGKKRLLSNRCSNYDFADSLIAYYDVNQQALKVFYMGTDYELESGLIGFPIKTWSSGDNTLAYVLSRTGDFKIWHQGNSYPVLRNVADTKFMAGKDIVAFTDETEQSFKAFYKGSFYDLEDFKPISFKVGNEFIAYVNDMEEFKIFYKGGIYTISAFKPESYLAKDNVLVYIENGYLKTWSAGLSSEIETYKPEAIQIGQNSVAYVNQSKRIVLYKNGAKQVLKNYLFTDWELNRDLIWVKTKGNKNYIYHNSILYENGIAIKK